MAGHFKHDVLRCAQCEETKNTREFTYANVWKLKEERRCKICVRKTKKKDFLKIKKLLSVQLNGEDV